MIERAKKYFIISICCIFLGSLQIAMIPLVSYGVTIKQDVISYAISGCLWAFLIAGYICLAKAQKHRRIAQRRLGIGRLRRFRLNVGLLNFNTSLEAVVAEAISILSLISLIVVSIFWNETRFAVSINASIFVFAFQMRSILNGRIYIDLKILEARRSKNG